METDLLKQLTAIHEDQVTPANMRNSEDIKLIRQLLLQSMNLFFQNNSIAGKDYVNKANIKLGELHNRLKNS